jgi:hypothetical protein
MNSKYFPSKEYASCPINGLDIQSIKSSYTKNLKQYNIGTSRYYNIVAKALGFQDWSEYRAGYESDIVPFMQKHGLVDYAPSSGIDILRANHDISFGYRDVADRLFFDTRGVVKKIFTAYKCETDNIAIYDAFLAMDESINDSNDIEYSAKRIKSIIESNKYKSIAKRFDYLIPMDMGSFYGYKSLVSDLFVQYQDSTKEEYLYQNYIYPSGLVPQEEHIKVAKILKQQLLSIDKGWIEVIPYNDNLIFLKADDGVYDFVFRNLRDSEWKSPYTTHQKDLPSIYNEEYDFGRWLYFGSKDKSKNIKDKNITEILIQRDRHLSQVEFYQQYTIREYPSSDKILREYYIAQGLYSYDKKRRDKPIDGYKKIDIDGKSLRVSGLISVGEFFEFYNSGYSDNRSDKLDDIYNVNIEDDTSVPVSVTWSDAIAYCRYIENEYNVTARLLSECEYSYILDGFEPMADTPSMESEVRFFLDNDVLPSPPPYMNHAIFDDVVMRYAQDIEYTTHNGIDVCTNTRLLEWSGDFRDGHAKAIYMMSPHVGHDRGYVFDVSSSYKYKYFKMGFRVCYESK